LEIVVLCVERNQESEFFHHTPKSTLVGLTIPVARAEVLSFFGRGFATSHESVSDRSHNRSVLARLDPQTKAI
jgi:hypothetical protein